MFNLNGAVRNLKQGGKRGSVLPNLYLPDRNDSIVILLS